MHKLIISLLVMSIIAVSCQTDNKTKTSEADSAIDVKVEALLAKMTLIEKIGQLNQYSSRWEMTGPAPESVDSMAFYTMVKEGKIGSMLNVTGAKATRNIQSWAVDSSRLGIPLILAYDVIHGYETMFPIPLAEAASWEPELAKKSSRIAAVEASAVGLHWTFAPMVDIARDARWGRFMEGSGEDPYLGAKMAYARVKGFQGDDLSDETTIAACAKHFAAYGFIESGRDYNVVQIGDPTLHNIVFPPFKACVDAGVATFMNAFNTINETPATASSYLQRDILKGEWGFDGFVVSDWNSIGELLPHGVAADKKEAALKAITAGSDMDMEGNAYINNLEELVNEGEVDVALIDDAVRRILTIKFKLGLFDDPYKYCNPEREKTVMRCDEHLAAAKEAAKRSIVLLKNENNLLPLKKDGLSIAVIGELAESKDVPLGSWRAKAITNSAVSLVEGIKNTTGTSKISFAKGPDYTVGYRSFVTELKINTSNRSGMAAAKSLASKSDVVVIALGEDCWQTGEGRSQTDISMKGLQQELLEEVCKVNKNVVVVLMNGRPIEINWMAENVPAIVECWHLGSEAGNGIAEVLFGDYNPAGKLPVSFPKSVGQQPLYYNHFNTGRPTNGEGNVFWSHYTDESKEPLYPFGYGLSYTTFSYSGLELSSTELTADSKIVVKATVTNTGEVAGEEIAQLYIRDLVGSISRPVKELKGFEKITLEPKESKVVSFEITTKDLEYYGASGEWNVEPGDFNLWVGPNSAEGLESSFSLK
ncbi:beta-glucosidase BglX [Draconibacterium sp. IB214405]|uniref:beta-glucosidase BglX n=1 Tax=Draconibacterium sp. IB214405 TaxID=3097352 RepID=UPI002A11A07A|nr:beta-glucosidase BglX [Draconibacterium sp. IB214405]MDX8340490.1 beta-glucosidase BglX [Draconibacterium sp. IB214405]